MIGWVIIYRVINNKYNYKFDQLDTDIKSFILELINPICQERLNCKNALLHNHLEYAKNKILKSKNKKKLMSNLKSNTSNSIILSQKS